MAAALVVLAVKGTERETYFRQAIGLLPLDSESTVVLAHAIDPGPRQDIQLGRRRFLGRQKLTDERAAILLAAEEERTRSVVEFAR